MPTPSAFMTGGRRLARFIRAMKATMLTREVVIISVEVEPTRMFLGVAVDECMADEETWQRKNVGM